MNQPIFHAGEQAAQARAGVASPNAAIRDWMPDQHRTFFTMLPFLPVATAAADGAPLATILSGSPGFITSPDPTTLDIAARPKPEDPAARFLSPGAPVGILGIDLQSRRRNRVNGTLRSVGADSLSIRVRQSFGNCPQYIQARAWHEAALDPGPIEQLAGLDPAARKLIATADTFFVASTSGRNADTVAGGMDISHRGGRPGFVALSDDLLTIPDFAGNHYFNTLGNFMLDPRAALLFVDWTDGSVLHLQGRVSILWDTPTGFPGAERLWHLAITGGWRCPRVLPVRWVFQDYARQTLRTGSWWHEPVLQGITPAGTPNSSS